MAEEMWRPGEFDPARWLFVGDPDNPRTTSQRCRVAACDVIVASRQMCSRCRRAFTASDLDEDGFLATFQPTSVGQRLGGQPCVVTRDGIRCGRPSISNRTGLCQAHSSLWTRWQDRPGLTLQRWCTQIARPLPARQACRVSGCRADGKLNDGLCGKHCREWRSSQDTLPADLRQEPDAWAARQRVRELQVHEFSLAVLAPTVRWELLYALQQRDAQGLKLDPQAMRGLATALADFDAVATTPHQEVMERLGPTRNVRAYANLLTRVIHLGFEDYRGISHTDKDIWDHLALDLETPRAGQRPSLVAVDFTPITQRWLREATKHWVYTLRPDSGQLKRTVQACTLAATTLSHRPRGGHDPQTLTFADMTAVFQAVKNARRPDGGLYNSHYRRGLWARLNQVLDLGRASGLLADLPGSFHRDSSHTIRGEEGNEDEIGKAIPETVIAQLDAHLPLLGTDSTYGRVWTTADTRALFQTI
jgi:hypothetical protein